jgi:signal transduction histidine kinase
MTRQTGARVAALTCVLAVSALLSEPSDWRPVSLVVGLAAAALVADMATFAARRIRISAGLMVQTTAMALLGPAPAAVIGMFATAVESRVHKVRLANALNNIVIFGVLGIAGGVLFDVLRDAVGVDRRSVVYAALLLPVYALLATANLALVAASHVDVAAGSRRRILRETGVPSIPLELVYGVLGTATVLIWADAGQAAAVALVIAIAVAIPLAHTFAGALKSGDDLALAQKVSDERAADVARLSSDRDRLLTELLNAEERERTRLAESLHDGPMQRLMALRQDAAEGSVDEADLVRAIAETRAIISAFHPATVRELGFEAALRAAVAPFPASGSIELTVERRADDALLTGSILLPIAQELVVNAVKHASPTAITVVVEERDGALMLEVNDDGVGIDTVQAGLAVQAGHVGLAMVRRRIENAGGTLEIATRTDGGTRSRVVL